MEENASFPPLLAISIDDSFQSSPYYVLSEIILTKCEQILSTISSRPWNVALILLPWARLLGVSYEFL